MGYIWDNEKIDDSDYFSVGLRSQEKVDFQKLIKIIPGYCLREKSGKLGFFIYFENKFILRCFKGYDFYEQLHRKYNVNWERDVLSTFLSKETIHMIIREVLFVIEVKCNYPESQVCEKLQTCDFKRKQYLKLVSPLGLKVEYVYVLNNLLRHPKYKDVLNYVHSVNCHYKFNELPHAWLGLPIKSS